MRNAQAIPVILKKVQATFLTYKRAASIWKRLLLVDVLVLQRTPVGIMRMQELVGFVAVGAAEELIINLFNGGV